jgi:WD40 repeat protein
MTIVYDSSKRRITLSKEVGHGGEAAIYRVQEQAGLLAKIYVPPIHPHYEPKVAWMRDHPPEEPDYGDAYVAVEIDEHKALAWPIELLYDRKSRFAGYLMPRIRGGVTLLKAFNPRERAKNLPFNRKYLHRTARNLAAVVASLHAKGYMVGDLHESNAIVTPQALVTMIDTDSFQVQATVNDEVVCYRCVVGKPEYTAPELQGKRLADVTREPEQDCFALAVLIFQLLMEGNHPFRSRWGRAGEPPPLEVKIARGLFPHVKPPPDPVTVPPNVPSLDTLHPGLSALMQRCFVDGHKDPQLRPTAVEWRDRLEEAEAALVQCRKGHYYSNLLVKCPQCEADKRVAKRKAAVRRQQGINFSPWLQQGQRQTARAAQPRAAQTQPAQPRVARTRVRPTTRAPVLKHALRQRLVVMGFFLLAVICLVYSFANISSPERSRSARVMPIVTSKPTSPLSPNSPPTSPLSPSPTPTLSPPLSGPPSQSMVAVSPENAKQIMQLDRWDHKYEVRDIVFSPDGTLLASRARTIEVWEVATGRNVRTFLGESLSTGLAFLPDGALIAYGTGQIVVVQEVSINRQVYSLTGQAHSVIRSVAFSPDGALLVSAGRYGDKSIKLWDVLTGAEVSTLFGHGSTVESVVFSPGGMLLASGGWDSTVKLWDVSTGSLLRTLGHDNGVADVAFSPDGTLLAAGSHGGTAKVWEVSSGREIHTLKHKDSVYGVAFSPDGTLLVTASGDKTLKLWQVSTGREVRTLSEDSHVYSVAFSPDGTLLASGSSSGMVTLWGVSSTLKSVSPTPVAMPDATSGVISGIVIDASTHLPISGASVTTDPSTNSVTTDVEGRFAIPDVPPGSYTVTVTKPGYAIDSVHVSVRVNGTAADVALLAFPQPSAMPTLPPTFPGATSDATSGVISGVVFDMTTELPMAGVNVTTDPPTVLVTTDAEGRFTIPAVPPGSYIVEATKHGLTIGKEATVVAGKETVVNFGMLDVSGSSAPSMPSAPGVP